MVFRTYAGGAKLTRFSFIQKPHIFQERKNFFEIFHFFFFEKNAPKENEQLKWKNFHKINKKKRMGKWDQDRLLVSCVPC